MAGPLKEFNDSNFEEEVLQSSEPVLVDFWAPWCGPCRMLAPTIEELAKQYEGRVKVGKLNTDDSPQTASRFGISSIPTVLFFKNGEVADRLVGLGPKAQFEEILNRLISE